jgi:phosphoribosylglycinamide formyltransferase-1
MPPDHHDPAKSRARIVVMLSGAGRTMQNLHQAITVGTLDASIVLVVASKECAGADRARACGIPTRIVPGEIPGEDLGALVRGSGGEWIVLCGYLRMVAIPRGFEGRVVNIHPALLPRFGGPGMFGPSVHEAVLRAKSRESGCTVHLCDGEYDHGRIILQERVPVLENDSAERLGARVFDAECKAYPRALQRLFQEARAKGGAP